MDSSSGCSMSGWGAAPIALNRLARLTISVYRLPLYDWRLDSLENMEALLQFGFSTKYTTATFLPQPSQKQLGKIERNKKQSCC